MYTRLSFIYKYETSALTPFVKPHDELNLAAQFYLQSGIDSKMNGDEAGEVQIFQDYFWGEGKVLVCRSLFDLELKCYPIIEGPLWKVRKEGKLKN